MLKLAAFGTAAGAAGLASPGTAEAAGLGAMCWRQQSVAQPIPNATWTTLNFDRNWVDVGGMFDAANPSRFIMPLAGLYSVIVEVAWDRLPAGATAGIRGIRVVQIGYSWAAKHDPGLVMPSGMKQNCQMSIQPGAERPGDYFEVQVFQNTGVTLNCSPDGFQAPIVMAAHLGSYT